MKIIMQIRTTIQKILAPTSEGYQREVKEHNKKTFYYSIALMMEAVQTSGTSVNFNVTTRCYIPEDSKLQQGRNSLSGPKYRAYSANVSFGPIF
jgi:hypothetical protein